MPKRMWLYSLPAAAAIWAGGAGVAHADPAPVPAPGPTTSATDDDIDEIVDIVMDAIDSRPSAASMPPVTVPPNSGQ